MFKSKLKSLKNLKANLFGINQHNHHQTSFSYHQISQLFKEDNFIPFSAYAISPTTVLHVLNDIVLNQRKAVIEFGAGASTFYIAKLIKTLDLNTKFYSVESNEQWAEELLRQLKLLNIQDVVQVIHAPIAQAPNHLIYENQKTWYDTNILENKLDHTTHFDLVLVDGPFGGNTSFARYSAIPFLKEKLQDDFTIYLDDLDRPDEQQISREWKNILNCKTKDFKRYGIFYKEKGFDFTPYRLR